MNEIFNDVTYVTTIGIALGFVISFAFSMFGYVLYHIFDIINKS